MFALVTRADGSSRGQPWLTYLLAVVLAVGFVRIHLGESSAARTDIDARLDELAGHWSDNPYLEVDARFAERLGGEEAIAARRAEWQDERDARRLAAIPASIMRRTQARFDDHLAAVRAELAQLPAWQLGVVDRSSPPRNWLGHVVATDSRAALAVGLVFVLLLGAALEGAWGPLWFGPFCAMSIAAGGVLYSELHGDLGRPWTGATGLCAALLGAYLVQGFRWPSRLFGSLALGAWWMALIWLGLEYGWVRGLRPGSLDQAPVAAHAALFAIGAVAALAIRRLGVERKLEERDEKSAELVSNPVIDRALADHEAGRSQEAFDALRPEIERQPRNRDLAVAFWTVANACGRPEEAVPVVVGLIRDALQRRRTEEAVSHWKEVAPALGRTRVEANLLVRIGEALLDAGEPDEALHALGRAVDDSASLASPLALRVIRVARDLDPALTARAASRALEDPQLDPSHRDELEKLSADVRRAVVEPVAVARVDLERVPADALSARAIEPPDRGAFDLDGGATGVDPGDEDLPAASGARAASVEDREYWNDPSLVEDLSTELPDEPTAVASALPPVGRGKSASAAEEPPESATATVAYDPMNFGSVDLAPEDGENTAPLGTPPVEESPPTEPVLVEPTPPPDATAPAASVRGGDEPELGLDLGGASQRAIKLLEGVPVGVDGDALKIEIEGRGRTRLPFERVEAVGVAAVAGLSARPVLVIDLVLNWMSLADEPLKVIRLRSDRFSPKSLVPGSESALAALKSLLATLLERSGATPLPDAGAARGEPFASHPDLESYQRDVLMVVG